MSLPRRTMRDIKSLAGKVDKIANPYMAYMQITCLEMEKARKEREKKSALDRVRNLDDRLDGIDREKTSLLRALAECGAARLTPPGAAVDGRLAAHPPSNGFKLRY